MLPGQAGRAGDRAQEESLRSLWSDSAFQNQFHLPQIRSGSASWLVVISPPGMSADPKAPQ